ncbi:MAG: nucleotidyltransferase domain-containing protein [Chloroflexi bacterium]|nr:nucleotidyltransferase domain-containing protein [Chloroflexota bacterium]
MLEQELKRYLALLAARADVERVVVFGSLVSGQVHAWSDLDLLIVQHTTLPFLRRLHAMRDLLHPIIGTDLLVYTPSEFEHLTRERAFVRDEIIHRGKVVYDRSRTLANVRA